MNEIRTCFASVSLNNLAGGESISLAEKLRGIARAGFQQIELGFPDILAHARNQFRRDVEPDDYDTLVKAGGEVKSLVEKNGLKILMLQPFGNFEGWLIDSEKRKQAFERAKGWIRVMQAVNTDMLQVGSTDTPSPPLSSRPEDLARDLAELADLLKPHGFRLCYENWCWATHGQTWKQVWNIVQMADRPNVGLCLDTFQEAGAQWADPTKKSGRYEHNDLSAKQLHDRYLDSLKELARTVPAEKIYVLQISDAYRPTPPLQDNEDAAGLRPKGQWSMAWRPLPFDGGYLPVVEMTRAVLDTGFRGVFSMEVFDGGPDGKGCSKDPTEYTTKAMKSLERLMRAAQESPF